MSADTWTMAAVTNPMRPSDRVLSAVSAGQSIADAVGSSASYSLSIEIGGFPLPRSLWSKVRPKAGQIVHAVNFPQGGNAGKWVRTALVVIISYYAPYLAGYAQGAAWGTAATGLSGALLTAGIMAVGVLAITPMIGAALEVTA